MFYGGEKMHRYKALRTITSILGFILVISGCVTSKNQAANENFGLTAKAVPEGILLSFSNIPADSTHMWIQVITWNETEQLSNYNVNVAYAGITDSSVDGWVNSTEQLEKVKQSGKVIFPIVLTGKKYHISAMVYNQQEFRQMRDNFLPRTAETECTAENGIYFNSNYVKLELNKDNSAVTLSSEPVFSSELKFDIQKYTYSVTILVSENESVGVGDHHIPEGLSHDGLTWTFEPHMTAVNLKEIDWLESGKYYPAWTQVYVNIIYDDILWSVEIAKTPEFMYSL